MKTVTHLALRHILLTLMVVVSFNSFAQLTVNHNPVADDTIHVVCFSGHSASVNLSPSCIDPDGGA